MVRYRAVAAAVAMSALVAVVPAGSAGATGSPARVVTSSGALSDLSPSTTDPTDGASAGALVVSRSGLGSLVVFRVTGLDPASAGAEYGAHVHVGPCVSGNGAAAGPHYNTTGGAVVDPSTEVWLDFTVRSSGSAMAVALVPFVVPPGGARSIVIHAMATMPNGSAGPRLACLPLEL